MTSTYYKKISIFLPYLLLNKNYDEKIIPDEWTKLIWLLSFHGLIPFFVEYGGLKYHDPGFEYKDQITKLAKNITVNNLKKMAVQKELGELLEKKNIPFVFLKGLNLSQIIYNIPTLRPILDIDILINEKYEKQVRNLLLSLGAQETGRLQNRFVQQLTSHDVPLIFKDVIIELHTHIVPVKERNKFSDINLWNQIIRYEDIGREIKAFRHVFYLLYLCYHAHKHLSAGNIKLQWYVDIACFISRFEFTEDDVQLLKKICTQTGTSDDVEITLYILQKHLLLYKDVFINANPTQKMLKYASRCIDIIQNPDSKVSFTYYNYIWKKLSVKEKLKYLISILFPSPSYIRSRFHIKSRFITFLMLIINPLRVILKTPVFLLKKRENRN